jgi:hypothetical protein
MKLKTLQKLLDITRNLRVKKRYIIDAGASPAASEHGGER